jgi:hypothetical protein
MSKVVSGEWLSEKGCKEKKRKVRRREKNETIARGENG